MENGKGILCPVPPVWISLLIAAAFLAVNLGVYRILPSYGRLFLDTPSGRLPDVTLLILAVPQFVWAVIGVSGAALLIAKDFWLAARSRGFFNVAFVLAFLVYTGAVVIGLFGPLVGGVIKSIE